MPLLEFQFFYPEDEGDCPRVQDGPREAHTPAGAGPRFVLFGLSCILPFPEPAFKAEDITDRSWESLFSEDLLY